MSRILCSIALSLAGLYGAALSAQSTKLNGPLVRQLGYVNDYRLSAAGDRVLFSVQFGPGNVEPAPVYVSALDGTSGPTLLGATKKGHAPVLSPDGSRAYFFSDGNCFAVPTDASEPPERLNDVDGTVREFMLSPDGQWVVYRGIELGNGTELFSVPADGSAPGVRISAPLASAWFLNTSELISPDSTRVVYQTSSYNGGPQGRLFSVAIDGSSSAILLDSFPIASDVDLQITSDGGTVVYRCGAILSQRDDLYAVPLDGSTPRIFLHAAQVADRNVVSFRLGADATRVVYRADHDANDVFDLYSAPVDGSAAPVRLSETAAQADVEADYEISPDGIGVAFRSDVDRDGLPDLYAVGIQGGSAPVKRSGAFTPGGYVRSFHYSPDNAQLVFVADRREPGILELYSAPVASGAPVKLHADLAALQDVGVDFAVTSDATRVLFTADLLADDAFTLHSAPIDGGGPTLAVSPLFASGRRIESFVPTADGSRVLYGEARHPNVSSPACLRSAPVEGSEAPILLTPDLDAGEITGDVSASYQLSPDGKRAAYLASQAPSFVKELWIVALDGLPAPLRLNEYEPEGVSAFAFGGDGSRIVFLGGALRSVPSDGSAPPLRLDDRAEFVLDPTGTRVAYTLKDELVPFPSSEKLMSALIDGSAPPKRLSDPLEEFDDIGDIRFTPDGARVLYTVMDPWQAKDLYSVRSDRLPFPSHAPRLLHSLVGQFDVTPGNRVVYVDVLSFDDLSSVHVDGGTVVDLGGTMTQNGQVESFAISPDGTRVAFSADKQVNERVELYVVPITGGEEPLEIGSITHPSADVFEFDFTPDGTSVVFTSNEADLASRDLYAVPADGSAPAVALDALDVTAGFTIAPDSTRAVFQSDQLVDGRFDLFSVALDGSGPAVRLNGALVSGGAAAFAAFTRRGTEVLYRADQLVDEQYEVFAVPIDGSASAMRLNPPLVAGGDVSALSIQATDDSSHVLYVADQDNDDVTELYRVTRTPPTATKPVKQAGGFQAAPR